MSGGSYDYKYTAVNDFIDSFRLYANTPLRKAFLKHLDKVSEAMRQIEWVDSADMSPGDEEEAIRKCLTPEADKLEILANARTLYEQLKVVFKK